MSQRVYLLHGFNVKDRGRGTIARLFEPIRDAGFDPKVVSNDYFHLMRVRMCNKGVASAFAAMMRPGSTVIGHSNAASIIWKAAYYGAKFDKVVLVNPALDRDKVIAPGTKRVQVWYSGSDFWTSVAEFLPFHSWGSMGTRGPTFDDPRYECVDMEKLFNRDVSHSAVFDEPLFTPFTKKVIEFISGGGSMGYGNIRGKYGT